MDIKIVLVITVAFLTSCASSPQSRQELKEAVKSHSSMTGDYTTTRNFDDVVATLKQKWQECYALEVTTTRTQNNMTTSRYRDTFRPEARLVNNALFELTLRMTTQGMVMLSKVPDGGEYITAIDVVRLPNKKTKVSWYSRNWNWKNDWEAHKRWIEGKNAGCPTD